MKSFILILLAISLFGCGSRRTFLDDFLVLGGASMSQIDQYFDLDIKQHEQLEKDIDSDLDRLRKERFKKIAKTLREIQKNTQKPHNQKIMSSAYADLQKEYLEASPYFRNSTTKLISSLRESQLKNFKNKVEKEISEAKLSPVDVLNEELIGRYKRGLEFWVGDLNTAQQQSIAQFTRNHPFPWNEKIKNKEAILNRFMAVHQDPAKLRKFSDEFVSDYSNMRIPEYAIAVTAYEKEFQNFLDSFWKTLSSEQKARVQEYLIVRADKMDQLARSP